MEFSGGLRGRRIVAAAATVVAAGIGLAAPALAAQSPGAARAGQAQSRAAVPWSKVGAGWSLAEYSTAQGGDGFKEKAGAMSLYLVDPSGGKYRLFTWAARSRQTRWHLMGWSGDVRRALFIQSSSAPVPGREQVVQLQLRTGVATSFRLPANVNLIGYTRPDGLAVLAEKGGVVAATSKVSLQRYSLTGKLEKTLVTVTGVGGSDLGTAAYTRSGTELATGGLRGLLLVSNAGGILRKLAVPGEKNGCSAVRWWSMNTILASCSTATAGPRMWLVPADGARPTTLTTARQGRFDYGDFDAWQLSSGLYVDGAGACGSLVVGRFPRHGTEQQITVPGQSSSQIMTATRSQLEVDGIGCDGGASLAWFNPATRAVKVVLAPRLHQFGVVAVAPYFVTGKF